MVAAIDKRMIKTLRILGATRGEVKRMVIELAEKEGRLSDVEKLRAQSR